MSSFPSFGQREEEGFQVSAGCGLSRKQRVYGFIICFCIGTLLSVMSMFALLSHNITAFAVTYTFGNIVGLASTGFLVGPWRQLKAMCKKNRAPATAAYFVLIAITLIVATQATFNGVVLVVLILICMQTFCLLWYSLTYIPYGQRMLKKAVTSCCGMM